MPKILTRYVSLWDFWVSFPNERCLLMMMSLEVWFLCGVLFATGSLRIGWIGQELSKGVAENVRDCFYLSTVPQKRCLDSLCVIKSSSQVFGLGRPVVPSYCNFPKLTTDLSHLRSGQVCAGVKLGSRFLYYCWHRRQEHCPMGSTSQQRAAMGANGDSPLTPTSRFWITVTPFPNCPLKCCWDFTVSPLTVCSVVSFLQHLYAAVYTEPRTHGASRGQPVHKEIIKVSTIIYYCLLCFPAIRPLIMT